MEGGRKGGRQGEGGGRGREYSRFVSIMLKYCVIILFQNSSMLCYYSHASLATMLILRSLHC